MSDDYERRGMSVESIVKWMFVGVAVVIALKFALSAVGVFLRFGLFAILALGPILFVGWLILKALRCFSRDKGSSTT